MLIYQGNKKDFMDDVEKDVLSLKLEQTLQEKMHRRTAFNEVRSWDNSMQYMYKVLNDNEIPDGANIAIEYNIPQTSKRVDFLISGFDYNDNGNVVIIELKQWEELKKVGGVDALVETYTGNGIRQVVHPSYQAWSYAALINDYNEYVQNEEIELHPCAYMHNYKRVDNDPVDDEVYEAYLVEAPVFTKGEVEKLRGFIKKFISKNDDVDLLYKIDNGKIKPSKSLQDNIASMVKGNKEFNLIDEQKVVYEKILAAAKLSKKDNKKRTIIVEGGPGTGKTVVAINLLSDLTRNEQFCQYVSKNVAPRNVYLAKLKGELKKSSVDNMFKSSGTYYTIDKNIIDTILVDEAHRLNEKSGMFKKGENQVKEIINASKCSVFFIDESQRVTISDIGSIKEIEKWATYYDSMIEKYELQSQFRCNGSNGYLAWLDNLLEIRETANTDIKEIDYDFKVFDDPNELRKAIVEKNKVNNKSRILAGYCWDWEKKTQNDSSVHDIKIGSFEMSWNLNNNSYIYAIDETSINEVGCIHTSQGLEFDYVGVIIGEDLRYNGNNVITDFTKRAKTDYSLFGIKTLYSQNPAEAVKTADEVIKNTYRTLMTRGMKGCYIYCVDKKLSDYIKQMIK